SPPTCMHWRRSNRVFGDAFGPNRGHSSITLVLESHPSIAIVKVTRYHPASDISLRGTHAQTSKYTAPGWSI
ncbi:MAG: hypothetical protein ACK5S9_15165, partial [Roseiflexaceae bacterium]